MPKPLTKKTPKKTSKKSPVKAAKTDTPNTYRGPAPAPAPAPALPATMLPVGLTPAAHQTAISIRDMSAQTMLLKVEDAASAQTASTMLSQLKTLSESWETERTNITKPLNEAKKRVDALFKPTTETLDKMSKALKLKVISYMEHQERAAAQERQKALAAAAEAQAKGDHAAATTAALAAVDASTPLAKTTLNEVGQTQLKSIWTFEVVDKNDIPREYLEVNEQAIRAAIRSGLRDRRPDGSDVEEKDEALKGPNGMLHLAIPGVRIFKTKQLAVSGA